MTRRLLLLAVLVLVVAFGYVQWRRANRLPYAHRGVGYIPTSQHIDGELFRASGFRVYETGKKCEELIVADFDNDAAPDVAVCSSYLDLKPPMGDVSIYRGDGRGGFGVEARVRVGDYTEGLAVGRFDGDGFLDLATADYRDGTLSVLRGGPRGPIEMVQTLALGAVGPRDVVAHDVDGDSRLDLVFCTMDSHEVGVARGRGDGTFVLEPARVRVGDGAEVLAVGRFYSESRQDLVTANRHAHSATVLRGDDTGTFEVVVELPAGRLPRHVLVADLDADGWDEFLVSSHADGRVTPYRNRRGDGFERLQPLTTDGLRGAIYAAFGDVDSDGQLDLAASLHLSGCIALHAGRGGLSFASAQVVPIGVSCLGVALPDLDQDGRTDLVVGNPLAARLQVYLQQPVR